MIKPLNNRILIKVQEQEKKEIAGLIIASQQESFENGLVLSIPSTEKEISVGDKVMIKAGAGHGVREGRFVAKEDVLGIYEV